MKNVHMLFLFVQVHDSPSAKKLHFGAFKVEKLHRAVSLQYK